MTTTLDQATINAARVAIAKPSATRAASGSRILKMLLLMVACPMP